jgi:hypothetical protein
MVAMTFSLGGVVDSDVGSPPPAEQTAMLT